MLPHRLSTPRPALLLACLLVLFTLLSTAAAPLPQTDTPPDAISVELRDKVQSMRDRYTHWQEPPAPSLLPAPGREAGEPGAAPLPDPSVDLNAYDKVAFQIYTDKGWEIAIMGQASGNTEFRLTDNYASDVRPRMTSDGEMIAYATNRDGQYEIYTTAKDATNVRRLTKNPAVDTMPAWSPSGLQLVFVSDRTGNPEIYVMNTDGSNQRQLTSNGKTNINPVWSPDGTRIAWVQSYEDTGVIALMNADGSNQHIITGYLSYVYGLAWSFDGQMLTFDYDVNDDYWFDIGVVSADGSGLRPVNMGTIFVDLGIGSWNQNRGYIDCFITHYQYVDNQGIFVTDSGLYKCFPNGTKEKHLPYTGSLILMYPDAFRVDPYAPNAWIDPLPAYSKLYDPIVLRASDRGVSGVAGLHVYKKTFEGDYWYPVNGVFAPDTPINVGTFHSKTGPVLFKVVAVDRAGNYEVESNQPEARTIIYEVGISGQITDARENPLEGASVTASPASMNLPLSDTEGRFNAYFVNTGQYNLLLAAPEFQALSHAPIILRTGDKFLPTIALSPVNNLVENGAFEVSPDFASGWTTGGIPGAAVASTSGFADAAAARLTTTPDGCTTDPCFVAEDVLATEENFVTFYDSTGTVHYFAGDRHAWRASSSSTFSSETYTSKTAPLSLVAAADSQDTLHLLFSSASSVYYTTKTAGGDWTEPELFPYADRYDFSAAVDSAGVFHLISRNTKDVSYYRIFYNRRTGPGQWSDDSVISSTGTDSYMLIPSPSGGADLALVEKIGVNNVVNIIPILSNGYIGARDTILTKRSYSIPTNIFAQYDSAGRLYIANEAGDLAIRGTNGVWEIWKNLALFNNVFPEWIGSMVVTPDGRVYLMEGFSRQVIYFKGEDSRFFQQLKPNVYGYQQKISTGWQGQPYLSYMQFTGSTPPRILKFAALPVAPAGDATLSQTMTLPGSTHKPTLSFQYALRTEFPYSQTRMEVVITPEGESPVTVFTSGSTIDWKHAWLDLSDYLGKTFTITFSLAQPEGEPAVHLLLDNVSVGAWETPVLESVSPSVATNAPITITLTGQNFMEGARVWVGDKEFAYTRNSDSELTIELPVGIAPGLYDVTVTNPGGISDRLPKALRVGGWLFVPFVQK